jgi:hypothetical protein
MAMQSKSKDPDLLHSVKSSNVVPLHKHASPLDLPAKTFKAGLDRRKANRDALMTWIRSALVEGADYGRIHTTGKGKCTLAAQGRAHECQDPMHWSKPSLWKPGAEKICGMLGVTVSFPTLPDYEQAALKGADLKHVILRCEIKDSSGRVVADGVGAREVAKDYGDLNKALKMAEKSSHIDATLRMAGLSEVFTQDLEDMKPEPPALPEPEKISHSQHQLLEAQIRDYGLDRERVKTWISKAWKVEHFPDLHPVQFERLLVKLGKWAEEAYHQAEAQAATCPL